MTSGPMKKLFSIDKFKFWYAGRGLSYKGIWISFYKKILNKGEYPELFQIRIIPFNNFKNYVGKDED